MHITHRYIHKYDCACNFRYSYLFTPVYWTSCCPHAHPILRKLPARRKRLSGPVTDGVGLRIPVRAGDYPPKREDRLCDKSSCLFSGYPGLFPGLKRPGRDVDHSPLFGVVFENEWVSTTAFHRVSLPEVTGSTLPVLIFDSQQRVVHQPGGV